MSRAASPPRSLICNIGPWPFVLAALLAAAAALPITGADWERGSEPLGWEVLLVGALVTGAIALSPPRWFAGPIALLAVGLGASALAYARELVHASRVLREIGFQGSAWSQVDRARYFENRTTWLAALAFATLAALAGARRDAISDDAQDRTGVIVGAWLAAIGALIAVVAIEAGTWRLPKAFLHDDYNDLVGGWGDLRTDALIAGLVVAGLGAALAAGSAWQRRRRRAYFAGPP